MRTDILKRKKDILKLIQENQSKAFISRELGCKQDTLNKYLKKMNIQYEGNMSGKGTHKSGGNKKMSFDEYLKNSKNIQSNKVRKKILEEKLKPHRCEHCGNSEWMGRLIPLELHHKDGNKKHNELSNYELLCPNCHAFTDSYRGKNSRK